MVPLGQFGAASSSMRVFGDAPAAADEADALEDLDAALLADPAIAVERAVLGVAVGVRGRRQARHKEAVALHDVAAGARHQPVRRGAHVDVRLPIDDAWIDARLARFRTEQLVPLVAGPAGTANPGDS